MENKIEPLLNNKFTEIVGNHDTVLKKSNIKKVIIFSLGPKGTNILKASKIWAKQNNIEHKVEYILCSTPEEALKKSKKISCKETFPIFALCAVYYNLFDLYFKNLDCYFFMDHLYMNLDAMVLAKNKLAIDKKEYPLKVAAHLSPAKLLENYPQNYKIIKANSNSHAAELCQNNEVGYCITTNTSKDIYSLQVVHKFGSPPMLFTFGTTFHGINLLKKYSDNINKKDYGSNNNINLQQ